MNRKLGLLLVFTIFLAGILGMALNIHRVKAGETIYINADGSINPPTANISSPDNITYTLTGDINGSIFIYRNDIVLDGAGYTIHGDGSSEGITNYQGVPLDNVTILNVNIDNVYRGIFFKDSSRVKIIGNNITNAANIGIHFQSTSSDNEVSGNYLENISLGNPPNGAGIHIEETSHHNNISGNTITNSEQGVYLGGECHGNIVTRNNITGSYRGIQLRNDASYGNITWNHIVGNEYGIYTGGFSACVNNSVYENVFMDNEYGLYFSNFVNNTIRHNYFMNNTYHAFDPYNSSINFWDYVGEGNYWDDYSTKYPNATEIDDSGIWDTPYVIDDNNMDPYPIIPELPSTIILSLFIMATLLAVMSSKQDDNSH